MSNKRCALIGFLLLFMSRAQSLTPEQLVNAHQLIPQFRGVSESVYAGAAPGRWSTGPDCPVETLAHFGFRTNVNLRNWRDDLRARVRALNLGAGSIAGEGQKCQSFGIECLHVPLSSSRYPSLDDQMGIMSALAALDRATPEDPAYVHCEYGIDRTGLIVALYRVLYQGWSPSVAYQEWVDEGHSGVRRLATQRLDAFFASVTGFKPSVDFSEPDCTKFLVQSDQN